MISNTLQTIENYLALVSEHTVAQIVLVLLSAWLLAVIADRLFLAWVRGFVEKVDEQNPLVMTRHGPLYYSVVLLGVAIAVDLAKMSERTNAIAVSLMITLAIIAWTRFGLRFSRSVLRSISQNPDRLPVLNPKTLPLFENTAYIVIIALSVYYVFLNWNVDMTAWLASAGIIGIAVGFAAKDTLANLFSGIFIMADAPYKIGDYVVLDGGERGEITKIGIRSTRLLTRDDVEVTIPNAIMGNSKVFNESGGRHPKSRICVKVGVAYGSDIDKVRETLMSIGLAEPSVCQDPEPRVRFRTFGASGLDFELLVWIEDPALRGRIIDTLNSQVYKTFMAQGIEIPYAKRDLYIKEMPGRPDDELPGQS